jgi:hypothetical protein
MNAVVLILCEHDCQVGQRLQRKSLTLRGSGGGAEYKQKYPHVLPQSCVIGVIDLLALFQELERPNKLALQVNGLVAMSP